MREERMKDDDDGMREEIKDDGIRMMMALRGKREDGMDGGRLREGRKAVEKQGVGGW